MPQLTLWPDSPQEPKRNPRAYKASDYHALASERGFEWIGELPAVTTIKTNWRCNNGHEWMARYNDIRHSNSNCPYCAGTATKIASDYHDIAAKNNIQWIGEFPSDTKGKTLWRCPSGHEWMGRYNDILAGHLCRTCGIETRFTHRRFGSAMYRALAEEQCLFWVGDDPRGAKSKTLWACSAGHRWQATYQDIKRGFGCPYCARNVRKNLADYYLLANTCGFRWIGDLPNDVSTNTKWQCSENHQWETTYTSIRMGSQCPYCHNIINGVKASRVQIAVAEMLGGELNYPCNNLRIDIALADDMIAVEYDGWHWHKDRLDQDLERAEILIGNGWSVLSIKSNTQLPTLDQLNNAIAELLNGATYTEIILPDWGIQP